MKRLLLIAVLLTAIPVYADDWSKLHVTQEVIWQTLNIAEWRQTIYISDHPASYYEWCGCMPKHPNHAQVNRWFAASAVLHYAVADYLPVKYREPFEWVTIGVSANNVRHNWAIGTKINF